MECGNPWLTIWTAPRATIAQIVKANPDRFLWRITGAYGFCWAFFFCFIEAMEMSVAVVGKIILAALVYSVSIYESISGRLIRSK